MAVGDQDGRRVAVAVPGMLAGGILETVDLLRGQIFPLPQIGVRWPARRNCPIYDGRGAACAAWIFHGKCPLWENDFPYSRLFAESCQFSPWAITTKFRG